MSGRKEINSEALLRTQIIDPDLSKVTQSPRPSLGKHELSFRTQVGGYSSDSVKIVVADEATAVALNALLHATRDQGKRLILSITAEDY